MLLDQGEFLSERDPLDLPGRVDGQLEVIRSIRFRAPKEAIHRLKEQDGLVHKRHMPAFREYYQL